MRLSRERIGFALILLGLAAGFVAIGLRVGLGPVERGNVYLVYSWAGRQWEAGASPYGDQDRLFRYSPLCAAAFVPWGWLPDRWGGLLWRAASAALLLLAALRFQRTLAPDLDGGVPFNAYCLLLLPWSLANLNNGQANLLLLALLLSALASVGVEAWSWTAALLAAAVWLKLYPLALAGLLLLWEPRRLGRALALFLLLGFGAAFLTQEPTFVWSQYGAWLDAGAADLRMDGDPATGNRDLWQVIRLLDLPLPQLGYHLVQLCSALGLAALAWRAQPRRPAERCARLLPLAGLAVCWMLLLGPATESSTYVLLCPFVAVEAGRWEASSRFRRAVAATAMLALHAPFLGSWIPALKPLHFWGLQQSAALLVAGLWADDLLQGPSQSADSSSASRQIALVASMRSQSKTATT